MEVGQRRGEGERREGIRGRKRERNEPKGGELSWEQRKGQQGWARGGWRNAGEGRAEVAASRVGKAAGERQAKRQQGLGEIAGKHGCIPT